MTDTLSRLGRPVVVLVAAVVGVLAGWFLFVEWAGDLADLLGIVLTLVVAGGTIRIGANLAANWFPDYNVAEVAVEGPITRDSGGRSPVPTAAIGATADEIVEQIERADEDGAVDALLVRLNTPGGEILPSDDIRQAVVDFDGPAVAYATDTCASAGYAIASGCDEVWAREGSIVGSVGVLGSRPNVSELADRLGVSYEQFTAGEYKDAGTPLKEMEEEEREYLQGIVDDFYDQFVETVAEGRDMDEADVRDTEAKVFVGPEAVDVGFVDQLGTREEVLDRIEARIGASTEVREFTPERGLVTRIGVGARGVAYAFGAGVASRFATEDGLDLDFRL